MHKQTFVINLNKMKIKTTYNHQFDFLVWKLIISEYCLNLLNRWIVESLTHGSCCNFYNFIYEVLCQP